MLPDDCIVQDVIEASTETIYNSFHRHSEKYSDEVVMEMANQLCLRGL